MCEMNVSLCNEPDSLFYCEDLCGSIFPLPLSPSEFRTRPQPIALRQYILEPHAAPEPGRAKPGVFWLFPSNTTQNHDARATVSGASPKRLVPQTRPRYERHRAVGSETYSCEAPPSIASERIRFPSFISRNEALRAVSLI